MLRMLYLRILVVSFASACAAPQEPSSENVPRQAASEEAAQPTLTFRFGWPSSRAIVRIVETRVEHPNVNRTVRSHYELIVAQDGRGGASLTPRDYVIDEVSGTFGTTPDVSPPRGILAPSRVDAQGKLAEVTDVTFLGNALRAATAAKIAAGAPELPEDARVVLASTLSEQNLLAFAQNSWAELTGDLHGKSGAVGEPVDSETIAPLPVGSTPDVKLLERSLLLGPVDCHPKLPSRCAHLAVESRPEDGVENIVSEQIELLLGAALRIDEFSMNSSLSLLIEPDGLRPHEVSWAHDFSFEARSRTDGKLVEELFRQQSWHITFEWQDAKQ